MTLTEKPFASLRKRRTRTLIQLGSLIEKSGLMAKLEIEVGDDLQEGPEQRLKAATLLGALGDLVGYLTLPEADAQKKSLGTKRKRNFWTKGRRMKPLFADLRALNRHKNVDRFYKIDVGQDLFKDWSVSLFYGRRGTKGTRRNLTFASEEEAFVYARKTLQNKKTFSKARGCAYEEV